MPILPPPDKSRIELALIRSAKVWTQFLVVSYLEFTRPPKNKNEIDDLVGGLGYYPGMAHVGFVKNIHFQNNVIETIINNDQYFF